MQQKKHIFRSTTLITNEAKQQTNMDKNKKRKKRGITELINNQNSSYHSKKKIDGQTELGLTVDICLVIFTYKPRVVNLL